MEDVGFKCEEAASGQEALEKFKAIRPDLVFMDLNMPLMDGYEVMEGIRRIEKGTESRTRLVVMTGSVFGEDRYAAAGAGADAFLMKPFEERLIWQVLEGVLDLKFVRETELLDEQVQEREFTREDLAGLSTDIVTALREAVESGDADAASELLDPLEEDHGALVAHLRTLMDAFDFDGLLGLLGSAPEA